MARKEAEGEADEQSVIIHEDEGPLHVSNQSSSRTVLPGPIASTVSAVTGVTALGWKVTSKVGGWWIGAAREATLTSLEVARLGTEAVLSTVGRDVYRRSYTEMGRAEAEGVLERTVSAFHSTISTVSILAATGFYFTSSSLNSVSTLSIQGLATLNAILGSTESSRAVAAIITLIRDELNKQEPGEKFPPIGYIDLLSGTVGFVLLQRWGRRKTELDFRERGGEETIWDTVIDDKGFRADVVGTRKEEKEENPLTRSKSRASIPLAFLSLAENEEIDVVERGTLHETASLHISPDDQTTLSDEEIRDHIMNQLPEGARAVISTQTITGKTIKVEIFSGETTHIEAPQGTVMIRENLNHSSGTQNGSDDAVPNQTVVFRTALKRSSSAEIEPIDRLRMTSGQPVEAEEDEEDVMMMTSSPVEMRIQDKDISEASADGTSGIEAEKYGSPESINPSKIPVANQKKSRRPVLPTTKSPGPKNGSTKPSHSKPLKGKSETQTKGEKTGPFRKALKSLSPSQSSTAIKDVASSSSRQNNTSTSNPPSTSAIARMTPMTTAQSSLKPLPLPPRPADNNSSAKQGRPSPNPDRTGSTQAFFTLRESRRDSTVSQTDSYSIHSVESRPGSPTASRTHMRTTSGMAKTKSDVNMTVWDGAEEGPASPEERHHRRSKSFVPSLYSMGTRQSEEAIILAPKSPLPRKSIYEDHSILTSLISNGMVPGIFPKQHLIHTARRFARFSSASYGANFLRVMGISSPEARSSKSTDLMTLDIHHEHSSFSSHTGLPADTILLSSFFDPQGVSGNTEWAPSAISPLIHFVTIDKESKAVVLTCRGTLGFEDVLTDMTCDYDDLFWQDKPFKVHKGIHASARRFLGATGNRIMAVLKESLDEFPDFGLVLCGHSLGGAVAALIAVLLSEPSDDEGSGASFVTAAPKKSITSVSDASKKEAAPISLPAGRSIHVYAYGPPATISESLRVATRGLITTIVNHADIVPSLSLGTLHDFRGVALNLKSDGTGAIQKLKSRVYSRITNALRNAFYVDQAQPVENIAGDGLGEDTWAWAALKTLRAGMMNDKLVPPGEVFVIETTRVFDRQQHGADVAAGADSATERVYRTLGRPATRVQFKFIRDVEGRFGELRFGRNMFSDHSPGRYEASLAALERGVLET